MASCHSQNGKQMWNNQFSNRLKILRFAQQFFSRTQGVLNSYITQLIAKQSALTLQKFFTCYATFTHICTYPRLMFIERMFATMLVYFYSIVKYILYLIFFTSFLPLLFSHQMSEENNNQRFEMINYHRFKLHTIASENILINKHCQI